MILFQVSKKVISNFLKFCRGVCLAIRRFDPFIARLTRIFASMFGNKFAQSKRISNKSAYVTKAHMLSLRFP